VFCKAHRKRRRQSRTGSDQGRLIQANASLSVPEYCMVVPSSVSTSLPFRGYRCFVLLLAAIHWSPRCKNEFGIVTMNSLVLIKFDEYFFRLTLIIENELLQIRRIPLFEHFCPAYLCGNAGTVAKPLSRLRQFRDAVNIGLQQLGIQTSDISDRPLSDVVFHSGAYPIPPADES